MRNYMSTEIEIEFKNLLTQKEYEHLKQILIEYHQNHVTQINYYFETPQWDLKNNGGALRVRSIGFQHTATLKLPNPAGAGLLEVHADISQEELNLWKENNLSLPNEIIQYISPLGIKQNDLQFGGTLKTIRDEYHYRDSIVVLDHNFYHHSEDFELELETTNEQQGKRVFQQILAENHIPIRSTKNKVARFYESLRTI